MKNELIIKCCKCVLVLNENELFNGLNTEILRKALTRGKGYQRVEVSLKRQATGCDKWVLYEALKGNRNINDKFIQTVENMPIQELKEGLLEFLLTKRGGENRWKEN